MHAMGVTLSWHKPRTEAQKNNPTQKKEPYYCHHIYPHCPLTLPPKVKKNKKKRNNQAVVECWFCIVTFPGDSIAHYVRIIT